MPLGELGRNIVSPILSDDKTWKSSPEEQRQNNALFLLSDDNKENRPPPARVVAPNNSSSSIVRRITPDRFPLVDPLKVQSKAKDPVIAPPKRSQLQKAEPTASSRPTETKRTSMIRPSLVPVQVLKSQYATPPVKMELLGRTRSKKGGLLGDKPKSIPPPPKLFAEALRTNLRDATDKEPLETNVEDSTAANNNSDQDSKTRRIFRRLACIATKEAAREAEGVLRELVRNFYAGKNTNRPDGACFNSVIHAYAELGDAEAAEAILLLMFRDFENGNYLAEPNVRIYTNVLHAWRKSKLPEAPERCEAILETMHQLHESRKLPFCEPDTYSYAVVFHCWAESNRDDAAQHADRLFRGMKKRFLQGQEALRPDHITYSNVLNIFASVTASDHLGYVSVTAKDSKNHARAEAILWEMVDDYLSGNKSAKPRIRHFNTVMAMWSKSSALDAPDRAQSIVRRLLELKKASKLDTKPDAYTYSLLLKTWASSKLPNGVTQAVKCLYWMEGLHRRGDEAARLDVIKYTTCISALARTGKADKAEALLNKMRADFLNGNDKAEPGVNTYESVINAWSGSNKQSEIDGFRAEALLRQMWTLHCSGQFQNIRPTWQVYHRVIIAMKKSHCPDRAEALLYEMDRLYCTGKLNQGPTKEDFQTVINAWNESQFDNRKMCVYNLQVKMQQRFRHSAVRSGSSSKE